MQCSWISCLIRGALPDHRLQDLEWETSEPQMEDAECAAVQASVCLTMRQYLINVYLLGTATLGQLLQNAAQGLDQSRSQGIGGALWDEAQLIQVTCKPKSPVKTLEIPFEPANAFIHFPSASQGACNRCYPRVGVNYMKKRMFSWSGHKNFQTPPGEVSLENGTLSRSEKIQGSFHLYVAVKSLTLPCGQQCLADYCFKMTTHTHQECWHNSLLSNAQCIPLGQCFGQGRSAHKRHLTSIPLQLFHKLEV